MLSRLRMAIFKAARPIKCLADSLVDFGSGELKTETIYK